MVLKDKLFFMFSGTSKCAIQLSDIAVQALYKLSLNLIFHSSEEFILKHFLENVSYFFMLNHIIFGTNWIFWMNCKQKIHCRMSLFASSKMIFTVESNIYFKLSM